MQRGLRMLAAFGDEIRHDVGQAALRAELGMLDIGPVQIRAVVAGQRHAARQVAIGAAQKLIHDPVHRDDAQAHVVDQAQVGGERDVVVVRVVIAGDIDGVIGQDGNAHLP